MSSQSPTKSAKTLTPVRPRTRSQTSREDLGHDSDRHEMSIASGDFDVFADPSSSFVHGAICLAEIFLLTNTLRD
jgi:hypothetical protein